MQYLDVNIKFVYYCSYLVKRTCKFCLLFLAVNAGLLNVYCTFIVNFDAQKVYWKVI